MRHNRQTFLAGPPSDGESACFAAGGRERAGRGAFLTAPVWMLAACVLWLLPMSAASQSTSQTPLTNPVPRPSGVLLPEANRLPDANDQMEMREKQTKTETFAAANAERRKQVAEDTAKLMKLAADLKAEVEKTGKDTLSLNVIRKADEIERLAHNVKEKMKLTVGGS